MKLRRNNTKKVLIDGDSVEIEEQYNEFYGGISILYRILAFIMFAIFLLYTIISAVVHVHDFSYENFEYIMRNFALRLEENKESALNSVHYNPDTNMSFSKYGKGLAICGSSQLSIFSATGRITCSENVDFANPVMTASDNYIAVFDSGKNNYSVYNSFSKVHSSGFENPIRKVSIANNGSHAIVTSSDSYTSVVEIFDDNFKRVSSVNIVGYVTAIDITDTVFLITSVSVDSNNEYVSSILCCPIGADKASVDINEEDAFPLECHIYENGFAVFFDNRMNFYNVNGQLNGQFVYNEKPMAWACDSSGALLAFKSHGFDTKYNLCRIDNNGSVMYSQELSSALYDLKLYEGASFILTDSELRFIDQSGQAESYSCEVNKDAVLIPYGETSVYLCTDMFSRIITFNNKN